MKKYFITYEKHFSRHCMTMWAESETAAAHIIICSGCKFISAKEIAEFEM